MQTFAYYNNNIVCGQKQGEELGVEGIYLIHPHGQWIPVCDQEPLSDVKLGVVDK